VPLAQLVRFVVGEFVEYGRAPGGPVEALDGEGQQGVPLQAGPEHAGVQQRGKHPSSVSGVRRGPSAALGDHPAGAPQIVQDGVEVVLIGQIDRGRLEGGVLRRPAPLAVCQHVMEQ